MGDRIKKLEEKINLMKEELHVIQRTKPAWAIETDAKLIDLEGKKGKGYDVISKLPYCHL